MRLRGTRRIGGLMAILFVGLGTGCNEDPKGPGGTRGVELLIYQGEGQVGEVGSELPLPLAVRVVDDQQRGMRGMLIRWEALERGGAVSSRVLPSVTNGFGVAEVGRTLGSGAGIHETVASLADRPEAEVRFTSVAQVQGVMRLVMAPEAHGDGQADTVLATLEPLRVLAVDYLDAPVAGAEVRWRRSGGGSLSTDRSLTDGDGIAEIRLTLGTRTSGSQPTSVDAWMPGISDFVRFQASTFPGKAVGIIAAAGESQIGVRGMPLSNPYVVHATDAHANLTSAEGIVIDWTVTSGEGSVEPAQTILDGPPGDEQGSPAGAVHTLGPEEGTHSVTATADGLPGAPEVAFEATAVSAQVSLLQDEASADSYWCLYYGPRACPHLFSPDSVAVQVGETVGWVWSGVTHSVVFEDDPSTPVSSRELSLATHLRTFEVPGTYRYRCTIHSRDFEEGMVGRVIVD